MRFHWIRDSKRRAVSPVIASILLISLAIAGAAVIATIYSNFDQESQSFDTDTISYGVSSSFDDQVRVGITKLSRDTSLVSQGIQDYTRVTINLDTFGMAVPIYVLDFDIVVYGDKLDDYSQWTIQSADDATYYTVDGIFAGYKQEPDTVVNYVVSVEDVNEAKARIPYQATFSYEVKYGTVPGEISSIVTTERISQDIFKPIYYNVSIFHYGSIATTSSAANQYEILLTSGWGSDKNLFFNYDRINDSYDYSDPAVVASLNTTAISEQYDVVIVDKWAVPTVIASQLLEIHQNGTSMIFYGGLYDFDNGNGWSDVVASIDYAATENITGAIPNVYQGQKPEGTVNGYFFFSDADEVLTGLSGEIFDEKPEKDKKYYADQLGYDAADLSSAAQYYKVYGNASYNFYDVKKKKDIDKTTPFYSHTGPLLIKKYRRPNINGKVYSFVWKTDEFQIKAKKRSKIDIINQAHLDMLTKNMLSTIITESDRAVLPPATLTINSIIVSVKDNGNKEFDIQITATVSGGNIHAGTLLMDLDLPDSFDFKKDKGKFFAKIDGQPVITKNTKAKYKIQGSNVLTIEFGKYYDQEILNGSVIVIDLNENFSSDGKWLEFNKKETAFYDWFLTGSFTSGTFIEVGSFSYTDNIAVKF